MDSMGYVPLRETTLPLSYELWHQNLSENVQIISGAQQGIDIISKAMLRYGDVVFVEKPTFYGSGCISVPWGQADGDSSGGGWHGYGYSGKLPQAVSSALYLYDGILSDPRQAFPILWRKNAACSSWQKDTIPISSRRTIFTISIMIREPIVPLKALDYKNRVIYIKSFSKILMPGLRMGLIVLPKKIHQAVMEAKYTTDISTSGFIQRALEYYLRNLAGGDAAQARRYGSEKYRKMLSATRKYLSDVAKYGQPNGGVSLWVELPVGVGAEALCSRMLEKNVILTPGSQYDISGEENRHIRLSFLNLSDDKIEVGLKRIGDMIRAMLEEKFLTLP